VLPNAALSREPACRTQGYQITTASGQRRQKLRDLSGEKRLLDEEVHYFYTLQWHRIIPHNAKVRGWTITPSHFLNQQLDTVWLAE
jgi:peptide/nickel transport system substrate-binding protein